MAFGVVFTTKEKQHAAAASVLFAPNGRLTTGNSSVDRELYPAQYSR